jgi:transketolase
VPAAGAAHLRKDLFDAPKQQPTRAGFGEGLVAAGDRDARIVALSADLTESTKMDGFREAHPDRFIEIGVAEQNLVTVAAGLALAGKIPFVTSYASFSPGRNWEQIRTTIALNETNVKIVGSHAGVSVGPDGATHQMLEDIALTRVLPGMRVVSPCDSVEAKKATEAIAASDGAVYLRLARADTPVITTERTPFELGRGQVFWEGDQVAIIATGPLVYQALRAARELEASGVATLVVNMPTIKPIDEQLVLRAADCGAVVTVEEAQAAGGLGGAVAELLGEHRPVLVKRVGVRDRFGTSGEPRELLDEYELSARFVKQAALDLLESSAHPRRARSRRAQPAASRKRARSA